MRIAPEVIDRVRDAANIVDVISQHLDLRKRGQNFIGICPFHNDTHPSLYVSPVKEIYKCFACGAGGNVFTFLMEYSKLNFVEVVKQLGDKYGITVTSSGSTDDEDSYTKLYEIHEFAADLFHKRLFSDTGKKVLGYLHSRGLNDETIKLFKIGFSFTGWEDLLNKAKKQKFPIKIIEKSGLFTKSEKGIFDRFRNRIMFPISHQSGKIIAFGGRSLDKDESAKYINSPDTILYHKSNILYGLQFSRQEIRKQDVVFLVEGYMDLIQLFQAGIKNVVAVSGTALTEQHVRQINKLTNRAYVMYDGDKSGTAAAIRAGYVLYQGTVEPKIIKVPNGLDPDDWVREAGKEAVLNSVDKAQSLIDFQIEEKNVDSLSSTEKSQFVNDILFAVARIKDSIISNSILKNISQRLQIDESELLQRLKREKSRQRLKPHEKQIEEKPMEFSSLAQKAQLILVKFLADENLQVRQLVRDKLELKLIDEPILKKIAELVLPLYEEINYSAIIDKFDDKNERELVTKILMEERPQEDPESEINDCIYVLNSLPIKEKIKAVRFTIRELEQQGLDPIDAVMEEAQLQQELRELK